MVLSSQVFVLLLWLLGWLAAGGATITVLMDVRGLHGNARNRNADLKTLRQIRANGFIPGRAS